MSINKFEDRIKSIFEQDRPQVDADAIWENIEPHLKKKKKRRGIIILFWTLGLGLLLLLFKYSGNDAGARASDDQTTTFPNEKRAPNPRAKGNTAEESSGSITSLPTTAGADNLQAGKQGSLNPVLPATGRENGTSSLVFKKPDSKADQALPPKDDQQKFHEETALVEDKKVGEVGLSQTVSDTVSVKTGALRDSGTEGAVAFLKGSEVSDQNNKGEEEDKQANKHKNKSDRTKKPKKDKKPWTHQIGGQTGSALALKQLRKSTKAGVPNDHLSGRKQTERTLESFTAGINYSAVHPGGLMIKTGLDYRRSNEKFHLAYFTKKTEQINGVLSITVDNSGNTIGQTSGTKTVTKTTEYSNTAYNHYQYVNLPVGLGYRFTRKKYRCELSAGVDFNLFFRAEGTMYNIINKPVNFKSGDSDYTTMFRKNTGMGLWGTYAYDWELKENVFFQLSATGQIPLNPVSSVNSNLVQRYFNFGVQCGVLCQLNPSKKKK